MNFQSVFDMLNMGIVILDAEYRIRYWNDWMAMHSRNPAEEMLDRNIFDVYPNLDQPVFLRSFKSVFTFGNFYFFSQKLHGHLFPIKVVSSFQTSFEFMQQSCTLCPLREGDGPQVTHICITVQDVTDVAAYEKILVEMTHRDSLTGTYNRRYFTNRLKEEFERHRRYKRPMSMLMIDIDHFKAVNDSHGHDAGDDVLREFALRIRKAIRNIDLACRYGGEEFVIVMPETDMAVASMVAERLRRRIATEPFVIQKGARQLEVTNSIGIAALNGPDDNAAGILKRADTALYRAKRDGRNRVVQDAA